LDHDKTPHTSGRGGAGNTSNTGHLYDTQASHPHPPNTTGGNPTPAYASGRGGAGNIHGGGTYTDTS
jgi:hypothetical protein